MKQTLIDTLKTEFGYPVRLQGSMAKDEQYPDSFFTVWNGSTFDGSHYDNGPIRWIWDFTIYFYSTDPTLVNTIPETAIALLKSTGWIIDGLGYDVPSDELTHTGRAFDALFMEEVASRAAAESATESNQED